jgi:hypothetical protein
MRPSDMAMRHVLVGQTMRPEMLMGALGISRTTSDTARVAGALAGTGGVALIGMGPAYVVVTAMYVAAFLLSLGVAGSPPRAPVGKADAAATRTLAGLKEAVRYVWHKPDLLGAFSMAFLVNLLAFPFFLGLLPYVARDVYEIGQSGLGYLAAAFATGALAGSLLPGASAAAAGRRAMLWSGEVGSQSCCSGRPDPQSGLVLLVSGFVQSITPWPPHAARVERDARRVLSRSPSGLPLGRSRPGRSLRAWLCRVHADLRGLGLVATIAIGCRWRQSAWRRIRGNSPS